MLILLWIIYEQVQNAQLNVYKRELAREQKRACKLHTQTFTWYDAVKRDENWCENGQSRATHACDDCGRVFLSRFNLKNIFLKNFYWILGVFELGFIFFKKNLFNVIFSYNLT